MSGTCLLTGAEGALGQVMQARLRMLDYQVVASGLHSDECKLDVCDTARFAALIEACRPRLIVHLAASFSNDFDEGYETNVEAVRGLLDHVAAKGLEVRIVLIGSAAEYGAVRREDCPITEERVLRPVSVYGLTKAWQTQMATLYAQKGVNVSVARVFNLQGKGISARLFAGRVQQQIEEVLGGKRQYIEVGPLDAIRDYVSLEQASEQIMAIAQHGTAGEAYHVASGRPVSMKSMLIQLLADAGLDFSIVRESASASNRSGYDVPVIYADINKTLNLMK